MTSKKHISILVVLVFLFTSLFSSFAFAADEMVLAEGITIVAKAHVQSKGDLEAKSAKGEVQVGTTGEKKRLESFSLELKDAPADMSIAYQAHVQTYGDLDPVMGPAKMGTTGEKKRVEAVKIALLDKEGDLYDGYSVEYRVHQQSYGWSKWVKDGEWVGVKGEKKRIEAIEVRVLQEKELKVEAVSAANLKEVKVVFNKPVDKDTVINDNFKVSNATTSATLTSDPKVVLLSVSGNGLTNQAGYTLTVENVKDAAGSKMAKATLNFTAFDRELPEVTGIVVTGPNAFDIKFSEPIKEGGVVEVKASSSVLGVNPVFAYGSSKISVNLYSNLVDGTEYTINIKEFKDYAGYNNVVTSQKLVYKKDNNAPVATIEKAEQNFLVVKFDKPVTGLTAAHFYHTFTAWVADGVYTDSAMTTPVSGAVDKVYVKFATYPVPAGNASLVIRAKANDTEIKDKWDNKFVGATIAFSVAADMTPPSVTELKVSSETSLGIKFSKNVTFTKDNVEILDDQGKAISGVNVTVSGSGKEYTINLGKNLAGKTIIVNIKNVEDTTLAANKLALYSTTATVTDKTAASVNKVTYNETDKALFVFFNEAVDNTALVAGNYYLVDGSGFAKLTKDPSFFNGNTIVKILLADGELTKIKAGADLFVTNVKDIAGNTMVGSIYDTIIAYNDDANKPVITEVKATDRNTLVITFDQYLTRVDSAAFKVVVGGTSKDPASMSLSTNNDGNTVVTLKSTDLFDYTASNVNVSITLDDNKKIYNVFGVSAKTATPVAGVVDAIAPAVAKDSSDKYIVDKVDNDTITIQFTENIKANTVSALTFKVKDRAISSISVNNNIVTINLSTSATAPGEITQVYPITDIAGNQFTFDGALKTR